MDFVLGCTVTAGVFTKNGASVCDGDCDDSDPSIFVGSQEYENGIDDDCDGVIDNNTLVFDDDGDGQSENDGDCDDTDAAVFAGAVEIWYDGIDQDCDEHDDFDQDGDGELFTV